MKINIKNSSDVQQAQQLNSWLNRPLVSQVTIELPHLDETTTQTAEKKIKYLFNDCGCLYGELVLFSFLVIKIAPLIYAGTFEWHSLWTIVPIALVLSLLGKFAGLFWSYTRLNNCLLAIQYQ